MAFERPFTVDEAYVTEIKLCLHADGATELCQFLLQLKDTIATIDNEKFWVRQAGPILAIAEPVKTVVHLLIPRLKNFPVYFLYISKQIKPEINADRNLRLRLTACRVEFEHGL